MKLPKFSQLHNLDVFGFVCFNVFGVLVGLLIKNELFLPKKLFVFAMSSLDSISLNFRIDHILDRVF